MTTATFGPDDPSAPFLDFSERQRLPWLPTLSIELTVHDGETGEVRSINPSTFEDPMSDAIAERLGTEFEEWTATEAHEGGHPNGSEVTMTLRIDGQCRAIRRWTVE